MTIKGTRQHFRPEFKKDSVALISKQGYSIPKVAEAVETTANNLRRWIKVSDQVTPSKIPVRFSLLS